MKKSYLLLLVIPLFLLNTKTALSQNGDTTSTALDSCEKTLYETITIAKSMMVNSARKDSTITMQDTLIGIQKTEIMTIKNQNLLLKRVAIAEGVAVIVLFLVNLL